MDTTSNDTGAFVSAVLADNTRLREEIGKAQVAMDEAVAAAQRGLLSRIDAVDQENNRLRAAVAAMMDDRGISRIELGGDIAIDLLGQVTVRSMDYGRSAVVTYDKPSQPGSRRVDMTLHIVEDAPRVPRMEAAQ